MVVTGIEGANERLLTKLVAGFPLKKKGDVLLQGRSEEAKGALKSQAQKLRYLVRIFPCMKVAAQEAVRIVVTGGSGYLLQDRFQLHFLPSQKTISFPDRKRIWCITPPMEKGS